jgi:sugar lactone lactonase YvrE
MIRRGWGLALLLLTCGCGAPSNERAQESRLPVWQVKGLDSPESVALAPDGRTLFVANVGGEGETRDGNGFISRVSTSGKLLQRQWITGLDAPKGATVAGGKLYVSDIDRLVEVDIAAGKVVARYPVPGATFLNDTAVAPDGTVLVTDSGTGRIFALKDGRVSVWSDHPELKSANGLLAESQRLMVTTMEGKLVAIDYPSRAVRVVATGLGQADGITPADMDSYLVSEWPGRLFRVTPEGQSQVLLDTRKHERYINDFIRIGDLIVVPSWKPGELSAYRVISWMMTDVDGERLPARLQRAWM